MITAEEFLREKYNADLHSFQDVVEHLKEFSKLAVDNARKEMRPFSRLDVLDLIQSLKDYTLESHVILGHDERKPEDFLQVWEADQNHP